MPVSIMFMFIFGAIAIVLSLLWNIRSYQTKNWVVQVITTITLIVGIVLVCIGFIYK